MIKIVKKNNYTNNNYLSPIRNLMVYDEQEQRYVEKYRLTTRSEDIKFTRKTDEQLLYAKGKINLVWNNFYKESNGYDCYIISRYRLREIDSSPSRKIPDHLFAFYKDGFYKEVDGNYFRYNYESLSDIFVKLVDEKYYSSSIIFKGWFLSQEPSRNEKAINSIDDVYLYTNLFDYSSDNSLPQITLYAQWEIPTYKLTIKNISGSSFYNNKTKKTVTTSYTFDVIHGTVLGVFLNRHISKLTFSPGSIAYHALDGTDYAKIIWKNPQKFEGWSVDERATSLYRPSNDWYIAYEQSNSYSGEFMRYNEVIDGKLIESIEDLHFFDSNDDYFVLDSKYGLQHDIVLYPQFRTLLIFKKYDFNEAFKYWDDYNIGYYWKKADGNWYYRNVHSIMYDINIVYYGIWGTWETEKELDDWSGWGSQEYVGWATKWIEWKQEEIKQHYRYVWRKTYRNYTLSNYTTDKVPCSSVIIYTLTPVDPYDWQLRDEYPEAIDAGSV